MPTTMHSDVPAAVAENVRALRSTIEAEVPPKVLDRNLVVASWRWPMVVRVGDEWVASPRDHATRDRRAVHLLAEIAAHFDVLAIQGLMRDAPTFHAVLRLLGGEWAYMMTGLSRETTYRERTAILFDTRKVLPQGLAGQIVLPGEGKSGGTGGGKFLSEQFFRPPFFAGFRCLGSSFTLVNQHIVYGKEPERVKEIEALGHWLTEVRSGAYWERNLIVVGQLQLMRSGSAVHQAFTQIGLQLPPDLEDAATYVNSMGKPVSMASSIAWAHDGGKPELSIPYQRGGVFNYLADAVFREPLGEELDYLSRHLPIWAEFRVDPGTVPRGRP